MKAAEISHQRHVFNVGNELTRKVEMIEMETIKTPGELPTTKKL
jgi:hypothetical protein